MNSYGSLRVDYCLLPCASHPLDSRSASRDLPSERSHLGIMKASFPSALPSTWLRVNYLSSVGCFQFLFGIFLCLNQLIASTRPTLGII